MISKKIKNRKEIIKLLKDGMIGLEVGILKGIFSEYLLNNINFEKLYSIDKWEEEKNSNYIKDELYNNKQNEWEIIYKEAKNRLKKYNNSIIIRKNSLDASKNFENNYFDFIFIDANHYYKEVKKDINAWWPKIKIGGIFSGHDYKNKSVGNVQKAVDEFIKEKKLKLYLTEIKDCWYVIK